MVDKIQACNSALSTIKTRSSITSLTENTPEAIQCGLFYDNVLTSTLRAAQWNFAEAFVNLAVLKAALGTPECLYTSETAWSSLFPPPPWLYSYIMPSDCLKVRYVMPSPVIQSTAIPYTPAATSYLPSSNSSNAANFKLSGDKDANGNDLNIILANAPQAMLCYTKLVTNPNVWDNNFFDLFVLNLAVAIAPQLTADEPTLKRVIAQTNEAAMMAKLADANDGLTIIDRTPDSLRARGITFNDPQQPGFTFLNY